MSYHDFCHNDLNKRAQKNSHPMMTVFSDYFLKANFQIFYIIRFGS